MVRRALISADEDMLLEFRHFSSVSQILEPLRTRSYTKEFSTVPSFVKLRALRSYKAFPRCHGRSGHDKIIRTLFSGLSLEFFWRGISAGARRVPTQGSDLPA